MCGITGFIGFPDIAAEQRRSLALAMADALSHRGPDDRGVFVDIQGPVALSHRRLKIIDLSQAAHQPMVSANGRWVVSYNGELYNFRELRDRLEAAGVALRSHSDTEVLLEWIARWGLVSALEQAEGMFAFALWDRQERTLALARDHVGIKPLFWARLNGGLLFGSELKALARFPAFHPEIDNEAVRGYLRYGYVSAPKTIFVDTCKLLPGHYLVAGAHDSEPVVRRYWNPAAGFTKPRLDCSDGEAREQLLHLVQRSVRQEMVADVPVGTYLSGGIDSSLITAIARDAAGGQLCTFSIGVDDQTMDESGYAAAVAKFLGTAHTEVRLSPANAASIIRDLPQIYDEPLSDMAQIPTRLISATARQSVTVALSGDGGDELFGGYQRYFDALARHERLRRLPGPLAGAAEHTLRALPPALWSAIAGLTAGRLSAARLAHLNRRLIEVLQHRQPLDIYLGLVSLWAEPPMTNPVNFDDPLRSAGAAATGPDELARFQFIDTTTYLPDAILAKLDRASMAVSLETRVPLLNRHIIEFAQRLPLSMRQRGGVTKWLLREALYEHVPRQLVDRPKRGFSVPMAAWLRGPLRDWADDLLSASSLAGLSMLRADPIAARWSQHRAGQADWSYSLWAVLVLVDWWRAWRAPAWESKPAGARTKATALVLGG